ncbi:hypothetical protein BGX33_001442 [Mortierella sp. NVP41]|nr:hypothetical protein BGX33_001442 [Mortierella sp. NVP41]
MFASIKCIGAPFIQQQPGQLRASSSLKQGQRKWNQSLTPFIYHTLVAQEDWSTKDDFPSLPILVKNAHSVRCLTLKTTVGLAPFLEQCTHLKTLVVYGEIFSKQQQQHDLWTELTELVRRSPLIERVFLGFDTQHSPSTEFLQALSEACPNMSRYESSQGKYKDQDQVEALMGLMRRINAFSTRYECFTNIPVDTTGAFPHMRELTLKDAKGLTTQSQVDLVCQCPNLEHLKWTVCRDTFFPVEQFCERVPAACSNLRKLQMDGCGIPYPGDLGRIISSLTQLELLAFCGTAILKGTFRSMERHFRTMRSVDIADCFAVKSWMVQETLESCPLLETLKCPYLLMNDVSVGKPWVSLRLKHLRVHFRVSSLYGEVYSLEQFATFEALARLTELQVLDTSSISDRDCPEGLCYKQDLGLSRLEALRKLTALNVGNTGQYLDFEDLRWMRAHWPLLTHMEGTFHRDWTQHELLTRELREYGIDVPDQQKPDAPGSPWAFDPDEDRCDTEEEEDEDSMYEYSDDDDAGEGQETLGAGDDAQGGIAMEGGIGGAQGIAGDAGIAPSYSDDEH